MRYGPWADRQAGTRHRCDARDRRRDRAGRLAAAPGAWQQRLWLAGSEAARRDAGYLAGAVEAAEYVATAIIARRVAAQ